MHSNKVPSFGAKIIFKGCRKRPNHTVGRHPREGGDPLLMTAGGGFDFCDTREGGDDERAMSRGLKPFAPSSFTGSKISGSLKYPILIDPKTKNFFSRRLSKVSWS